MHPVFRLLGWTLLVALLIGVMWPERDPGPEASTAARHAPDPGPPLPRCDPGPGCAQLTPTPPTATGRAGSP